jgi:hypothetical protein
MMVRQRRENGGDRALIPVTSGCEGRADRLDMLLPAAFEPCGPTNWFRNEAPSRPA